MILLLVLHPNTESSEEVSSQSYLMDIWGRIYYTTLYDFYVKSFGEKKFCLF